ncbi:uncharacterized protein isoform X1 [Musca autumnalis]|uniref:uncharacterized protein isoform X1 n=1 Tax=Musca autumnalis TaxID=221902 RepID=UPI003CE9DFF7
MAKFLLLSVVAVVALVQVSSDREAGEAINNYFRQQLSLYDSFAKAPEATKFTDDLKKLIQATEDALKIESLEEKQNAFNNLHTNIGPEFGDWIVAKLLDAKVNEVIAGEITFYKQLLKQKSAHEAEIRKTIATLEGLLKESDFETKFVDVSTNFSPVKDSTLPVINDTLQKTVKFFETILGQNEGKFVKEITDLKTKVEGVLGDEVSVREKIDILQEISMELDTYLTKKQIELA